MRNILAIVTLLVSAAGLSAKDWTEYTNCQLAAGEYHDGDSFSQVTGLKTGGQRTSKNNWRLYGVDCPETDARNPERLQEQARAFGVPEAALESWGKKAAEFSARFLDGFFQVYTLREDARGASDKPRYFAIIVGADGRPLHEALLEAGLARAYGMPAAWPEGTSSSRFESHLRALEAKARQEKAGIWGASQGSPSGYRAP